MKSITVKSYANIALCKYWGKRDQVLMLPTKSSISLSLAALNTISTVMLCDESRDIIILNGQEAAEKDASPIKLFFDTCRQIYGIKNHIRLVSHNNFAHSAGMASSASGFSALALGLNALFQLGLTREEMTILARRGSGSACRSLYGGFVCWQKGMRDDGLDSIAQQIVPATYWPTLRVIIVVISSQPKSISSREGMLLSTNTSPFYTSWLEQSESSIPAFIEAIQLKDLMRLGKLAEAEWILWQQVLKTTMPALSYINQTTVAVMSTIENLRAQGIYCYCTTDAGPNIHILCQAIDVVNIQTILQNISGIQNIIISKLADNPVIMDIT